MTAPYGPIYRTSEFHTISDYIQEHKEVHQRMLAAKYPNIEDDATTVDFLIQ